MGLGRQVCLSLVPLAGGFLMLSLGERKRLFHYVDSAGCARLHLTAVVLLNWPQYFTLQ